MSNIRNVSKDLTITRKETKSKRYPTYRAEEVLNRDVNAKSLFADLEEIMKNPSDYSVEEFDIYEKRYRSLLLKFKKKKTIDENQLFIPFVIDNKGTVVYIREKHLTKTKWVKKIGIKNIKKRLEEYKSLLHKKPEGVIYWNPFF